MLSDASMEWLDAHAGSVQAVATLVLMVITAYYAFTTRSLLQQSRAAMRANARTALEGRLDRLGELLILNPELSGDLDAPAGEDDAPDRRFHFANMLLGILEEAHTQYEIERAMPEQDWRAWVVTMDQMLHRGYMSAHWRRVGTMYSESFQRLVEQRLQQPPPD